MGINKYLFVFFYSLGALGCDFNFADSNVKQLLFTFQESPGACQLGQQFIDRIRDVTAWSRSEAEVTLRVAEVRDGADFDGGSIVESPLRFVMSSEMGRTYSPPFIYALNILAHEYGHAIFEKAAGERVPAYASIRAKRVEMSEIDLALLHNPANREALERRYLELKESLEKNRNVVELWVMVAGYSEFIADVVAVFESGSKSSIYDALVPPWASQVARQWLRARDFSANNDLETWTDDETHGLFGPARTYVGAHLWPNTNHEKKRYLELLIDASIAEINERVAHPGRLSPTEINRRLIARLR